MCMTLSDTAVYDTVRYCVWYYRILLSMVLVGTTAYGSEILLCMVVYRDSDVYDTVRYCCVWYYRILLSVVLVGTTAYATGILLCMVLVLMMVALDVWWVLLIIGKHGGFMCLLTLYQIEHAALKQGQHTPLIHHNNNKRTPCKVL